MTTWKCVGISAEGERIVLSGVNPWNYDWSRTKDEAVQLPHPSFAHQLHRMTVYEIEAGGRSIIFAAGEVSPNVWGFYVPG